MKSLFDTTLPTTPLERAARDLAEYAHQELYKEGDGPQLRKYTGEPYVNHLAEVVGVLRTIQATPRMLAAAWLHDVLEDTTLGEARLRKEIGHKVADMVIALTDSDAPGLNRAARQEATRTRLARQGAPVQTIKLADIISNVASIVQHDPKFAKVYLPEKEAMLQVLALRGHPRLWLQARRTLEHAKAVLGTA